MPKISPLKREWKRSANKNWLFLLTNILILSSFRHFVIPGKAQFTLNGTNIKLSEELVGALLGSQRQRKLQKYSAVCLIQVMEKPINISIFAVNNSLNDNETDINYTSDNHYVSQKGIYSDAIKNVFEFSSYLGLVGNLLMVIIFIRRPRIQPPDYFLINLAVIDLLYASGLIINTVLNALAVGYHNQNFTLPCISLNLFNYFLIVPTLYTLAMITMERIVIVINIRLYRRMVTKKNIFLSFVFIYTISSLAIIPNTLTHCLYKVQPPAITYAFQGHILLLALIVSTLMITLCVLYCRILQHSNETNDTTHPSVSQTKEANSTLTNLTDRTAAATPVALGRCPGPDATHRNKRSTSTSLLHQTTSRGGLCFMLTSGAHRNGMPNDMTNLSVVNNMHGRVVISPLRPDVIERQARLNNSVNSSGNSSSANQPINSRTRLQNNFETSSDGKVVNGKCASDCCEKATAKTTPGSPHSGDTSQNSVSNDKKTFYLLTAISGLFILLYWPNIIATALFNLRLAHILDTERHLWFFILVNRMSLLHTLVNPLTSLVISSRFRSEIKQLFMNNLRACSRRNRSTSSAWNFIHIFQAALKKTQFHLM